MLKNKPLVSIIIPTFNREKKVCDAVETVLSQNYPDTEIIVVDDGSTDGTRGKLLSFGNTIRIIHQENRGVSAARNRGVAVSTGKWIAFLDSDDLWLPGKLSAQMAFFDENDNARICQTEEIWIRNGVRVNPKKKHQKPSGMIFKPSLALCLVSPSAVMMERTLFDEMDGFDESLPACEDYDLWLRISLKYPVYLISTPYILKRGGHADQLSRQSGLDRYRIQSLVKILQTGTLTPDQFHAAGHMLAEKCRIYANGCLRRKREKEAAYYKSLPERISGDRSGGDP